MLKKSNSTLFKLHKGMIVQIGEKFTPDFTVIHLYNKVPLIEAKLDGM